MSHNCVLALELLYPAHAGFESNNLRSPRIPMYTGYRLIKTGSEQKAQEFVSQTNAVHELANQHAVASQQQQEGQAIKKRRPVDFEVDDMVFHRIEIIVYSANTRTIAFTLKLADIYIITFSATDHPPLPSLSPSPLPSFYPKVSPANPLAFERGIAGWRASRLA